MKQIMLRLQLHVGLLYATMTILIMAAMLIGQARRDNARDDFFAANPCELPCMYGIQLGVSKRADIARTMNALGTEMLDPAGAPIIFTSYLADETRYIDGAFGFETHRAETPNVQFAQFYANQGTRLWTLGELLLSGVTVGYTPTHVYRTCPGFRQARLLIGFDSANTLIAGVPANTPRITPHTPVTLLYLSTGENMFLSARQGYFGGCYIETRWYGFTTTGRYFYNGAQR